MAEKKTIVNLFDEILAGYALSDEHRTFLESRKAQTVAKAKANSTKQLERAKEKEKYKANILSFMQTEGKEYRVSELVAKSWNTESLSAPNVTNMLTAMVSDGVVKREVKKGVAYYSAK